MRLKDGIQSLEENSEWDEDTETNGKGKGAEVGRGAWHVEMHVAHSLMASILLTEGEKGRNGSTGPG